MRCSSNTRYYWLELENFQLPTIDPKFIYKWSWRHL